MINRYLEDLELRINQKEEELLISKWEDFIFNRIKEDSFNPSRKYNAEPHIEWPEILINHAIDNNEHAIIRELKNSCSDILKNGGGSLLCIRPNYGTGILSSAFGAELFFMEDDLNTLPITKPVSQKDILKILDKGIPSFDSGLMQRVFETGERMVKMKKDYPLVNKYIHVYHPDFQGPMDIVELLWGSEIFTDVYFNPDEIKALLQLVTDTYIRFLKKWHEISPDPHSDYSVHWGMLHKGHTMIRNDSAMNFPPEIIKEFIFPYDQQILDAFDGGAVHFCGRGIHYIEMLSKQKGLHAINLTQPECNDDMEEIYLHTVDKGIKLIGLSNIAIMEAFNSGRKLKSQVHNQGRNPSFDKRK